MKYQTYYEMPFKKAFRSFPELFSVFPLEALNEFFSKDEYIVRIDKFSERIEIGFASDDWVIH